MDPKYRNHLMNNGVKLFLQTMLEENEIDEKQFNKLSKYAIVTHTKGWFDAILEKLFGIEGNQFRITVVKIINVDFPNDEGDGEEEENPNPVIFYSN